MTEEELEPYVYTREQYSLELGLPMLRLSVLANDREMYIDVHHEIYSQGLSLLCSELNKIGIGVCGLRHRAGKRWAEWRKRIEELEKMAMLDYNPPK